MLMCSWAVVFSLRITGLYLELRVLIFVATEVQKSALSVLLLCHIGSDEHASVLLSAILCEASTSPLQSTRRYACRIYFSVGVTEQFPAVSALCTISETVILLCDVIADGRTE